MKNFVRNTLAAIGLVVVANGVKNIAVWNESLRHANNDTLDGISFSDRLDYYLSLIAYKPDEIDIEELAKIAVKRSHGYEANYGYYTSSDD